MRPRALAGRDGRAHGLGAAAGGLRVEVDLVLGAGQAAVEIGRVPRQPVGARQRLQLVLVAPDQDRLGVQRVAVAEIEPTLRAQRDDRADEVLVGPHAPRHPVHDDADAVYGHVSSLAS